MITKILRSIYIYFTNKINKPIFWFEGQILEDLVLPSNGSVLVTKNSKAVLHTSTTQKVASESEKNKGWLRETPRIGKIS